MEKDKIWLAEQHENLQRRIREKEGELELYQNMLEQWSQRFWVKIGLKLGLFKEPLLNQGGEGYD